MAFLFSAVQRCVNSLLEAVGDMANREERGRAARQHQHQRQQTILAERQQQQQAAAGNGDPATIAAPVAEQRKTPKQFESRYEDPEKRRAPQQFESRHGDHRAVTAPAEQRNAPMQFQLKF